MRANKLFRYIIYMLLILFAITRMWASFRVYVDIEYSPISTVATIILILFSFVPSFFLIRTLTRSGLNILVLSFMLICVFNSLVYCNPNMELSKQLMCVLFWESCLFLFFFLSYYNSNVIEEGKVVFILLLIPLGMMFFLSNILKNELPSYLSEKGNNNVFYLLTLLPWIMVSHKRWLRFVICMLIMAVSVFSFKRSAMIISGICLIAFIYDEYI